jgi:hypothetical protein
MTDRTDTLVDAIIVSLLTFIAAAVSVGAWFSLHHR